MLNLFPRFFDGVEGFALPELFEHRDDLRAYLNAKERELIRIIKNTPPSSADHEQVVVRGIVHIGKDCDIDPFVLIEGPVWIGDHVRIRSGAIIRPGTILGNDVVIGHGAEVKNAHIGHGAKLQTNVFVGDSIVGCDVRVGSGTILANRRFDQKEIFVEPEGNKIATGVDKFGCLIGDRTRIGANVTTTPGTLIGRECLIYAGASVSGFISPQSIVKLRQTLEIVPRTGDDFTLQGRDQDDRR